MTLLRLALRNLCGAGLRTGLNALVLSLVMLTVITAQALLKGMNEQAARAGVAAEYAGGQAWHPAYDPYDPLSLGDAHAPLPPALAGLAARGRAAPVLVTQGTIYPGGRLLPVLLKGIDPAQQVVDLPTAVLAGDTTGVPVLVGARMARAAGLEAGDAFVLQWRDRHGTFDAREARVAEVFRTPVQSVDQGVLWLPLARLREMTGLAGEATLVTVAAAAAPALAAPGAAGDWAWRDQDWLLSDIRGLIRAKMLGSMVVYALLLLLALLAVFDSQVFAIFRRQREIGTLVALGMTRRAVAGLFTLEGALVGLAAALLAALYGTPLLAWFARVGWKLPETTDDYGYALGDVLYPVFSLDVVAGTVLIIWLLAAVAGYLPTRRIARVNPTDALRGRVF